MCARCGRCSSGDRRQSRVFFAYGELTPLSNVKARRGWWWKALLALVVAGAVAITVVTGTSVEFGLQQEKTGSVVEAGTGRQIPGAYVVARWYRYHVDRWSIGHGGGGGTECVYRAIAQTDANGRYIIPSSQDKFVVRREWSIRFDNRYFWDLDVYVPGYSWVWPQRVYHTAGGSSESQHPHASFTLTKGQQIRAIELTPEAVTSDLSLNEFPCAGYDGFAVSFFATLYREAYGWDCEQGGRIPPRRVAELRERAWSVLPPLSRALSKQLDEIRKHYRFNDPPSTDDDEHICAILKQANEESQ